MSIFKGLGETYNKPVHTAPGVATPDIVGPCLVMDVMLKKEDAKGKFTYTGPADIGKIRIKSIFQRSRKEDEDIEVVAYPADRKIVSYPLPGEIVFVHLNNSDEKDIETSLPVTKLYYQTTSTQNGSITYNSLPDAGDKNTSLGSNASVGNLYANLNIAATTKPSNLPSLDFSAISQTVTDYVNGLLQKFNSKLKNRDAFIKESLDNNNVLGVVVKERPALQPYEGDSVYQGRFGQSIRFGSTTKKEDNDWSKEGLPGAPIMIHRVHDKVDPSNQISHTTENINEDNSSIYLCSTQKVEMRLSCSTNMHSWRTIYRVENKSKDPNVFDTVSNKEDGTLIYQKVVDMGQTLDSQLNATGSATTGSATTGSATTTPGNTSPTNQTNTTTPPAGG
jgi:hypothetical protein